MSLVPIACLPTDLFKCLSDPYRLLCVILITRHQTLCVCDLMQMLSLNQPKVSRYLSDLRKCHILTAERKGQWVYYQLHPCLPNYANQIIMQLTQTELLGLPEYQPLQRIGDC